MISSATLTSFDLANETGILASVGAALAVEDTEVLGFALCSRQSLKTVHVITEDPAPSMATLDEIAITRRCQEVLVVDLGGPRPGLGEVGRRLAEAGVNVGSTLSTENGVGARIALAVDEPERARKALDRGGPVRARP